MHIYRFNKLKFRFSIVEDYEKESAFFLSPSQELTGLPLGLCVIQLQINSPLTPSGETKGPLCPFRTTKKPLWVPTETVHKSLGEKAPLATLVEMRRLQGGNRKSKSSCMTNRICVKGAERVWAIPHPLAQNSIPVPHHNLMWISGSPDSPPIQNLNTWAKHFQRVNAQIRCTCLRPHSASIWANALQTTQTTLHVISGHHRPQFGLHRSS